MNFPLVRFVLLCTMMIASAGVINAQDRHRVVILADMGNEPDEVQQMIHMVTCCNEFDVEGLIAVTGKYLRPESNREYRRSLHPELFHEIIDAYEKVVPNLKLHADGWPTPDHLRSRVATGQRGYGVGDIGEGKSSEGSKLIESVAGNADPRPLWVVVNAGSNTLAQRSSTTNRAHRSRNTSLHQPLARFRERRPRQRGSLDLPPLPQHPLDSQQLSNVRVRRPGWQRRQHTRQFGTAVLG